MIGQHVVAAALACGVLGAGLAGARGYVRSLEDRDIGALAPKMIALKNQGSELQRAAFRQPDLLVIYGSSELEQPNPYHGSTVFENYPTGFTIFPVGSGGTTSLVILQDVAAVGAEARGKKVVISVSPPWFFLHDRTPDFYKPNYSPEHLSALVFGSELSFETKQLAIRQLMQSPSLFKADPLVDFAAQRLAEDGPLSRAEYLLALPLGMLHNTFFDVQDMWATYSYIQSQHFDTQPPRTTRPVDWSSLTQSAEAEQAAASNNNELGFDNTIWSEKYRKLVAERQNKFTDGWFLDNLVHNAEFTDLRILLRGLSELGAEPLLISQPIPGTYYDTMGISAAARSEYYARLREIAASYDVPLVDFADHDDDIYFVADPNSHLSRKGWTYYDHALDAFYHGDLEQLARTAWSASALLPGDSAGVSSAVR